MLVCIAFTLVISLPTLHRVSPLTNGALCSSAAPNNLHWKIEFFPSADSAVLITSER